MKEVNGNVRGSGQRKGRRRRRRRISAQLTVAADTDQVEAERVLQESGQASLASNSMTAETHLDTEILVAG